ncbi:MAG TPA: hypothetical protein VFI62_17750 [Burkholderiales bacterium]|nr:hypothetical protein [Burkholderiales bacterium]
MSRLKSITTRTALALALQLCAVLPTYAAASTPADTRRALQLQQQQDALNLQMQQGMRARRQDLDAEDARRLEQLHMQQRLQQQQLEHRQLLMDNTLRSDRATPDVQARIAARAAQFALERQVLMQRFEIEQQQLLNSAQRRQLQPPPAGGRLDLP